MTTITAISLTVNTLGPNKGARLCYFPFDRGHSGVRCGGPADAITFGATGHEFEGGFVVSAKAGLAR